MQNVSLFKDYNNSLRGIIKDECCLGDFCSALVSAGKSILESDDDQNPGWFELNKEMLVPLFEKRNELLFRARI